MTVVETTICYNYELNFPGWVLCYILKLGLGYNDVKVSDTIMLLICPGLGTEKAPSPLLFNRSTLNSCHLFIVTDCRHLAIFIVSPYHLFFEDTLHQNVKTVSTKVAPALHFHPSHQLTDQFKRRPRLSLRWFAIPHLAGQQSEQADILFITLQNSEQIQRKLASVQHWLRIRSHSP